jgi:hypothetical protein
LSLLFFSLAESLGGAHEYKYWVCGFRSLNEITQH